MALAVIRSWVRIARASDEDQDELKLPFRKHQSGPRDAPPLRRH